eukprot:Nk52_evm12s259 gene=Nk52_evmTU12s259
MGVVSIAPALVQEIEEISRLRERYAGHLSPADLQGADLESTGECYSDILLHLLENLLLNPEIHNFSIIFKVYFGTRLLRKLVEILQETLTFKPSPVVFKSLSVLNVIAQEPSIRKELLEKFSIFRSYMHIFRSLTNEVYIKECLVSIRFITRDIVVEELNSDMKEMIEVLVKFVCEQDTKCAASSLGILSNISRTNPIVQEHIKQSPWINTLYRTCLQYLSSEDLAVVVTALSVLTTLTIKEEIGQRLFNEKNINSTFMLVFNLVNHSSSIDILYHAADILIGMVAIYWAQKALVHLDSIETCIESLVLLLAGDNYSVTMKVFDVLTSFCQSNSKMKRNILSCIRKYELLPTIFDWASQSYHSVSISAYNFLLSICNSNGKSEDLRNDDREIKEAAISMSSCSSAYSFDSESDLKLDNIVFSHFWCENGAAVECLFGHLDELLSKPPVCEPLFSMNSVLALRFMCTALLPAHSSILPLFEKHIFPAVSSDNVSLMFKKCDRHSNISISSLFKSSEFCFCVYFCFALVYPHNSQSRKQHISNNDFERQAERSSVNALKTLLKLHDVSWITSSAANSLDCSLASKGMDIFCFLRQNDTICKESNFNGLIDKIQLELVKTRRLLFQESKASLSESCPQSAGKRKGKGMLAFDADTDTSLSDQFGRSLSLSVGDSKSPQTVNSEKIKNDLTYGIANGAEIKCKEQILSLLRSKTKALAEADNIVAEMMSAKVEVENELEEAKVELEQARKDANGYESSVHRLKGELAHLGEEREAIELQMEKLFVEKEKLLSESKELESIKVKYSNLNDEKDALESRYRKVSDEKDRVEEDLAKTEAKNRMVFEELKSIRVKIEQTAVEVERKNDTIMSLNSLVSELKERNKALSCDKSQLESTVSTLRFELSALEKSRAVVEEQAKSLEFTLGEIQQQLKVKENIVNEQQSEIQRHNQISSIIQSLYLKGDTSLLEKLQPKGS